ncbi:MAG: PatB family C-S lyase [Gammaproteobacteria bacterium]|nr:PatB family C-S lyase [Gammaproteobacteria bacterium]
MSIPFNFDKATVRTGTHSSKWDKYSADIIPLWVADMDFECAPVIMEALQARLAHGIFGYTRPANDWSQVVVDYYQQQHNWTIQPEWVVWVPGVVASMHLSCLALSEHHNTVLTPEIIYPHFHSIPVNCGKQRHLLPMTYDQQRLRLDLTKLSEAPTTDAKIMLFCNPQNPGGCVYTHEELKQIDDYCQANKLILVSDEIHCDLILDQNKKHIPYGRISEHALHNSVVLGAASKTYNVAGLACSWAVIANDTLRPRFKAAMQGIVSEINPLGFEATVTALQAGNEWHSQLLDYLRGNRDYLAQQFATIDGIHMLPLASTFLAWIDISELNLENPTAFFEAAGVGMSPGSGFNDKRFMRLNFGCQRAVLEEAIARIRRAL